MAEYIELAAVLGEAQEVYYWSGYENRYGDFIPVEDVLNIPAADVAPVVHGRWLSCEVHNDIEQCSECGMIFHYPSYYGYKFCPNCGAKMDKGER